MSGPDPKLPPEVASARERLGFYFNHELPAGSGIEKDWEVIAAALQPTPVDDAELERAFEQIWHADYCVIAKRGSLVTPEWNCTCEFKRVESTLRAAFNTHLLFGKVREARTERDALRAEVEEWRAHGWVAPDNRAEREGMGE